MKTEKNILLAFLLNLFFSVFEFIGGSVVGSVAIISDAIHDMGDAFSIGISYLCELKSKKQPDSIYTYGYLRYSVLGSLITTVILLLGSATVIYNSIHRIFTPVAIDYSGMILFAVIGVVINCLAAYITHGNDSINQKAVNLHMLEDVLGWIVVLIGAIIMHFTDAYILDPIMSIGVSLFILIKSLKNLKSCLDLLLEKIPSEISVDEIHEHILNLEGVIDVHHIHIWSLDGQNNYATMHIVTEGNSNAVKDSVRHELSKHGITHSTLELENETEECHLKHCHIEHKHTGTHNHHH